VGRKKDLDDLVTAFDRAVHKGHPNLERINCPGWAALMSLANKPEDFRTEAVLDHVRQCTACLDELKELRRSRKGGT
jgi:hypothetical protein